MVEYNFSFFSDDNWEDLDIDQSINCGIDYEEIIPSDSEDHTQLNVCHCMCHKPGDNTHCRSCGLKVSIVFFNIELKFLFLYIYLNSTICSFTKKFLSNI